MLSLMVVAHDQEAIASAPVVGAAREAYVLR